MLKNHQSFRNPIRYQFGIYQILNSNLSKIPTSKTHPHSSPTTAAGGGTGVTVAASYLVIRPPTIALIEIKSDLHIFNLLKILHEINIKYVLAKLTSKHDSPATREYDFASRKEVITWLHMHAVRILVRWSFHRNLRSRDFNSSNAAHQLLVHIQILEIGTIATLRTAGPKLLHRIVNDLVLNHCIVICTFGPF